MLSRACGFPVRVTGVIVPVGAAGLTVRTPPRDVHVVNRLALVRWLRGRPVTLDDDHVAAVYAAARWSTTWLDAVAPARG